MTSTHSVPCTASRKVFTLTAATLLAGGLLGVASTADAYSPSLGDDQSGHVQAGSSPQTLEATQASSGTGGWVRYPASSFTSPAGDLCAFAFRSVPVFDQVYVRTTATFKDGSPRVQEYAGPLVVRLKNAPTGATIQRDLSGRAVAKYKTDGSYDLVISGPVAIGFRPGDSLPRGYYVLRGFHVVHFAADGTRTITKDGGSEENLCTPLARRVAHSASAPTAAPTP